MSQKTFGKQLTVVDTKSRVKMHKSGKNWVRTVIDFLRNKIWYNSSMNYEASKQLTDVRFKRLVGVQRTTFEEMLAVLKTAYQRKHAKGG
uniref:KxYKxGKxW signal peptide domain-containing protein n=1 Tax=Streptococcus agalactiae TaxID=1311 RepID=UPI00178C5433